MTFSNPDPPRARTFAVSMRPRGGFKHSWEEAVNILRDDPAHQQFIFDSYLTRDLLGNSVRFAQSAEFKETLALLRSTCPGAVRILDMPGGNGIATYAFASAGLQVTTVEPNPSASVGRLAIATVISISNLRANIVAAWGERLPFRDGTFDAVYVRQGLHHAADLKRMLAEIARVLRTGGVLLACREHVIDDYGSSLQKFLDSQVDHQLYGGENAFTLPDYTASIVGAGLTIRRELGPFDSIINQYPNTDDVLAQKILESRPGRTLRFILPSDFIISLGRWWLKRRKHPGRMYSFVASKAPP